MPIVVAKGNEHNIKKKLHYVATHGYQSQIHLNADSESDDESEEARLKELEKIKYAAFDMADVVHLKVYRVSKPHFVDGSVKTSLVGDVYYTDEGDRVANIITRDTQEIKKDDEVKASLLQKIRAFRSTHHIRSKSENKGFLSTVREDVMRFKMIKAGQPLAKHLKGPTSDEVLEWAIKYVNTNEQSMIAVFLELVAKVKSYNPNSSSPTKSTEEGSKRSPKIMQKSLNLPHVAKTSSSHMVGGDSSPLKGTSTPLSKPAALLQQLENLKTQGTEHFLRAVMLDLIKQRRGSRQGMSSRQSSSREGSAAAGEGLGGIPYKPSQSKRSNASPRGRGGKAHATHNSTLTPLMSLKSPSDSVAEEELLQDSMLPTSSEPVAQSNPRPLHNSFHLAVQIEPAEHTLDEIPEADTEEDVIQDQINSNNAPPLLAHINSHNSNQVPHQRHRKVVQPPARNDNKMKKVPGLVGKEEGEKEESPRPVKTASPTNSRSKAREKVGFKLPSKPKTDSVKYSSSKVDAAAENDGVLAYEQMRRTQAMFMQSMGYTLGIFKKTTEKYDSLHKQVQKKLKRADKHGHELLAQCEAYTEVEDYSELVAHQMWEEKQHNRLYNMNIKTQYFNVEGGLGLVGSNAADELRKVRNVAEDAQEQEKMKSLIEVKWFVSATFRLRDYMRRMNNSVPICSVKLIVVIKSMITLGFKITIEIFYFILLSAIFQEEDFRKNIVNQIIDVIRAGLDIRPEDFLAFLEEHNIQPPPELLNEIRLVNSQKSPQPAVKFKFPPTAPGVMKSPMSSDHIEEKADESAGASIEVKVEHEVVSFETPFADLKSNNNAPKEGLLASDS